MQRIRKLAAPLQSVFERMVAWQPARRFNTFNGLIDRLKRVQQSLPAD